MKPYLSYKGFRAVVSVDLQDGLIVGRLVGTTDVVSFHATDMNDLEAAFVDAVEDYVEACAAVGKEPVKEASGNLMLRIDPQVHGQAIVAAQLDGKSLNQWSEDAIRRAADELFGAGG